jgi:hypothetical protein
MPRDLNSRVREVFTAMSWVLIGVLVAATLLWMLWANQQPNVPSVWGGASGKPLN